MPVPGDRLLGMEENTTQRKTLTRTFSWHMLSGVRMGWPFTLEVELRKMLELYPNPETIVIRLEGQE